jgi:antirestriction protein ArdC
MSRHDRNARVGADRTSLYDDITNKIIAELEAGRVPWVQLWGTAAAKAPLAMPANAATGRQYSGINVLILWGAVIEHGFPVQSWLTFRQALSLGGHVRKGERGTTVVYADRFIPADEKKRAQETGEEAQAIPFLKRFTVFNVAQCEDLPDDIAVAPPAPEPGLIEPRVEALIKATGIDFRIGGDRAFYVPAQDYVQVPPPQAYFETINWHRAALHELGHATGHASRLGRDLSGSFGSKKYAFEELVAEMNAAFCCASLGITPTVRHADYIGSWLEVLREHGGGLAASERRYRSAIAFAILMAQSVSGECNHARHHPLQPVGEAVSRLEVSRRSAQSQRGSRNARHSESCHAPKRTPADRHRALDDEPNDRARQCRCRGTRTGSRHPACRADALRMILLEVTPTYATAADGTPHSHSIVPGGFEVMS